jgi:ABC-type multidrug transport system ATPase subunit
MTPVLSFDEVTRRYGKKQILRGVTFCVDPGEAVGLIGPNGAGKTTLLRIGVGLLRPDTGLVSLDGEPVGSALRRVSVGYFAGESTIPAQVRARKWLSLFHDVDRSADNRPVRVLSRGTRQLLGLRMIFSLQGIRLIVLDEPWEGLDPDASRWLTESLRARRDGGTAVLVSSHRLHDLANVCDRYVFLDRGRVTSVPASALIQEGAVTGEGLMVAFDKVREGAR